MSKKESKFKIGDYIKVVKVDDEKNKKFIGRSGRILNIHLNESLNRIMLEIEYDIKTLKSFNEFDLKKFIKDDDEPFYLYPPENDCELIEVNETIEELENVQDLIEFKTIRLSKQKIDKNDFRYYTDKYIRNFLHSNLCMNLNYEEKSDCDFVIDVFSEHMFKYFGKLPKDWDDKSLKKVCTETMPYSVTVDSETIIFPVLDAFLKYLEQEDILKSQKLQKKLSEIKDKMNDNFKNTKLWGPAKTFFTEMKKKGINPEDKDSVQQFMEEYNANIEENLIKKRLVKTRIKK